MENSRFRKGLIFFIKYNFNLTTKQAVVKEENLFKVKNRVKFNGIELVENFKLFEAKPEHVLVREKSNTVSE